MGKVELNMTNNQIAALSGETARLSDYEYENIFKMFRTDDGFYGYNILKTVIMPEDLEPSLYDVVIVDRKMSWTNLSFLEYGTIKLWWVICLTNKIQNPVQFPAQGMRLRIIKKDFIPHLIKRIKDSMK
jgi:hypothetical protein